MAKIKIKTHRGAAKRFAKIGSAKGNEANFKCKHATRRHILTKRTTKNLRQLRGPITVGSSNVMSVRQMLPNGT